MLTKLESGSAFYSLEQRGLHLRAFEHAEPVICEVYSTRWQPSGIELSTLLTALPNQTQPHAEAELEF